MTKKFIAIIISVMVLNLSDAGACSFTCDLSEYTGTNAALRSAIMPGWGQGWNEQTTKGWIVFGIFALSVFGGFYYNNSAEKDYEKYEKMGSVNGSLYDDYETHLNTARTLGIIAAVTWIYAVVDAYIVADKKSKTYVFNKKIDVTAYNNNGVMVKYRAKFSI